MKLKSGDSYLRERKGDGAEVLTIKDERHAGRTGVAPVSVVLSRSSGGWEYWRQARRLSYTAGEVRWMEVRDWLKRASDHSQKPVSKSSSRASGSTC